MAARGQNQGKGKNKQAYAPKPKIPPSPKRGDPTKDSIYHECGETGHWKRNCPHKKHITKLQHDGLLDSTDLKAFEKCVSCMSEKMARKPYTHQVERAKDLFGLIHTDHKHEVFETLKVFQKEAENQLDKTIKSPRSNHGGEYMSQEFLDHLKDHEVIAHRTPPYTPHYNGVSERRNRTLLDMVRSMMSQTTLPKSFWDYALETTTRILNMTPYEVWHGKAPKLSYLKVCGYEALVKQDTLTKPDKLEPRSIKCIFIGYLKETMGYSFYYPLENKMDVKTAFLNGYLNEKVYMEQPEGFINPKYSNRVCKLKRSIYGLKQASRQQNKRFDDEIKKFGFTQNRDELCVYLKAGGSNITLLILYVDDILFMGNNILMLQSVKSYLGRCFAMKDLGEAAYILGIKIYKDRSRRLIGLCQSVYIKKILKRYCMVNSNRGSIPMQEKLKLSRSQGASTPANVKRMQNVSYASAVGSIIGDLKGELRVSYYTDAGYLTDADDLKSQTGYVFVLNGGAVD
nr:retrotransposon protein, putative, Ty1-copia subclass [Tanacetum cinerariifolium]